jgi:hypothetical protein
LCFSPAARPKIRSRLISPDAQLSALAKSMDRCKAQCLRNISVQEISAARTANANRGSNREVHQWLCHYMATNLRDGRVQYQHQGVTICRSCFGLLHGVSDHSIREAQRAGRENRSQRVHGNSGPREAPMTAWAKAWLNAFFNAECDTHASGKRYLPTYLQTKDIAESCAAAWRAEHPEEQGNGPSLDLVRKLLRNDFPDVVRPLQGDWGCCKECLELAYRRKTGVMNDLEAALLKAKQEQHRKLHRHAREQWEERRRESKEHPEKVLHLTMDLTRSTLVPNFRPSISVSVTICLFWSC